MISRFSTAVFGSRNQRLLKRFGKWVAQINQLEPEMQGLSDADLQGKTAALQARIAKGATLDSLLVEAFAVVREASLRTLGLRHYDVQLLGGMVLHSGKIAEMHTGEGKTLVATLPAYLNALSGKGVHIVTVNDYLAKRDAEWMAPIFKFLQLSVGVITPDVPQPDKAAAYACDIVYGTNNEFGFDYLRDNMVFSLADKVQRSPHYAIVDEVDSILIDEARTPLIISGPMEDLGARYQQIDSLAQQLTVQAAVNDAPASAVPEAAVPAGDFSLDEKTRQVHLTEAGHQHLEQLLQSAGILAAEESLYDVRHIGVLHQVHAALRARYLYHRDVDYIVRDDEVIIVDEHTGRTMLGRRWSDGLHQAVEVKENVSVQHENQTLASITFQNYFRLYDKLAGMTGTADTEAYEFQQIYGLEVAVVPTNKPMIRQDRADQIYLTQAEKFTAIVEEIKRCQASAQPVLVGTASIEVSEYLSGLLDKAGIKHHLLNAKFHAKEASIIAEAGRPGGVTIATNMAGRGTDIVLGGNLEVALAALESPSAAERQAVREAWQARHDQVLAAGGLHVLGTERNESRRSDNQLRGRAGRQGDPGSSQFYLSLEDNLMRIFASDRVSGLMRRLGMRQGEMIQHPLVNKAIANAQRKVEGHHFDVRKQLLEFDDVANDQRQLIYQQRDEVMRADSLESTLTAMQAEVIEAECLLYLPMGGGQEEWRIAELSQVMQQDYGLNLPLAEWAEHADGRAQLQTRLGFALQAHLTAKRTRIGGDLMHQLEKNIVLQTLDLHWKEHMAAMGHLRQGIHLRGYAQKNPVQEYKRESFALFQQMLDRIRQDVVRTLAVLELPSEAELAAAEAEQREQAMQGLSYHHAEYGAAAEATEPSGAAALESAPLTKAPFQVGAKVGRNDPCPCGSGQKYKRCHGNISAVQV